MSSTNNHERELGSEPGRDPSESPHIHDLLRLTAAAKASDLHLKVGRPPVLRIHGRLIPQNTYAPLQEADLNRFFEQMATPEEQAIFAEKLELDFAYALPDVARFRVNVARQRGSVSIVMRRLDEIIPPIDTLGIPAICKDLVMRPRGLVLVTGITGSGKSTTLASMLNYRNQRDACRIITIEDPIEYLFEDDRAFITQRELGNDTISFAEAIKHSLRQDPDVILVGEMRDLETIAAALTAAETGHLVLSTLHTAGAALTVDRMIDAFPPHQQQQVRIQLADILLGVLSQTLLPRADGNGRVPAVEVMIATSAVRNLVREGKSHQIPGVIETGQRLGMQTMDQALTDLYRRRLVTLEEVMSRAVNADHMRMLLRGS
ncbi:MAG: type IV pilus twitching motility protein PilT [Anaerolineae bacterium]|nr:type IV pilus twitching motility protein PilT [Anaerolineae bacterium]